MMNAKEEMDLVLDTAKELLGEENTYPMPQLIPGTPKETFRLFIPASDYAWGPPLTVFLMSCSMI